MSGETFETGFFRWRAFPCFTVELLAEFCIPTCFGTARPCCKLESLRRREKKILKKPTADSEKSHMLRATLKQLFANGLEINACLKFIDNNNLNSSLLSFEPLLFPAPVMLYTMRTKLSEHLRYPLTLNRFYDSVRIYQLYFISLEDSTLGKMVKIFPT